MKNARPLLVQKFWEIIIDALLILFAFWGAYVVRIGQLQSTDFPFQPYFQLALFTLPFFLLVLAWSGLYELREKTSGELLRITSISALSGAMLFVLFFFFKREFFFSRAIVLLVWVFSTILIFGFHFWLQQRESARHRAGKDTLKTLIIGNGRVAASIIHNFKEKGSRFQPVAILAPYGGGTKEIDGVPVLGKLDALEKVTGEKNIDAIIQTEAPEQSLNLLNFSEGKFLEFLIAPQIFGCFSHRVSAAKVSGMPFIRFEISPLFGWGQVWKRMIDIFVSALIILFLSPLFLLKKRKKELSATGPKDQVFEKYSFANASGIFEHVPEFLNVFRGEMSLVGPRPRSPEERDSLKLHERRRLVVKPGILGLWQLHRLKTGSEDMQKEIELDTKYIFYWSVWKDVVILWESVVGIFSIFYSNKGS